MWIIYALLGAFFAALTSILAKIGIENVNSNLATAIRTVVVLIMSWGIVLMLGKARGIGDITQRSWIFLILSGVATGISWLFFYKALQIGDASKVIALDKFSLVISLIMSFVILRENLDLKTVIGGVIVTVGMVVLVM